MNRHFKVSKEDAKDITVNALKNSDFGELFMQYYQSESIVFVDNVVRSANFNSGSGYGLRAVTGHHTAYSYGSNPNIESLKNSATIVANVKKSDLIFEYKNSCHNNDLYNYHPNRQNFARQVTLLQEINDYLRSRSSLVTQVSLSVSSSLSIVEIIKANGEICQDIRPLSKIAINIIATKNGRSESGYSSLGGRENLSNFTKNWKNIADTSLEMSLTNLESIPAPAGQFPIVLASGNPGILIHEAIGHSLEGDFNRKKTSVFSESMGKKIAAADVTIMDDALIPLKAGSLNIDDEGTPGQSTILIEDGILVNYMNDNLNGNLMGGSTTANCRRQDYTCLPMPRMRNTYMKPHTANPEDLIKSVKNGLYIKHLGGGQVDQASGKFVFYTTEAYLIEAGKVTQPIKGATLIGSGPEIMQNIAAIGSDFDLAIGTCGKSGQSVPVTVGQPTILVSKMTIGGTSL